MQFAAQDFEVVETERRSSAAIALLVDMSYSMELRGTWGEAKTTAMALHSLVTTKYPQDKIEIIGFSDYARVLSPRGLIDHDWDRVQGTNLQHGLMLARRHLDKHRDCRAGDPGDHRRRADRARRRRRLRRLRLAAECQRRSPRPWPRSSAVPGAGATINVFMLDDEPRLVGFMQELSRRNGGRLFMPKRGALGQFVVADYLDSRRGRRRRAS